MVFSLFGATTHSGFTHVESPLEWYQEMFNDTHTTMTRRQDQESTDMAR